MKITYTHSEKNDFKYTVKQAVDIAAMLVKGKVCINALTTGRAVPWSFSKKITLEELNNLVDQMVDDSRFYNYHNY